METQRFIACKKLWGFFIVYTIFTILFVVFDLPINKRYETGIMGFASILLFICLMVLIKNIEFTGHSVKINGEDIKYSAFDEVYISKKDTLSLRSENKQVISETTLKLFSGKQIEQIIKEFEKRNKLVTDNRVSRIKDKTKFMTKQSDIGGSSLVISFVSISGIIGGIVDDTFGIVMIIFVALFFCASGIYSLYKGGIYFSEDKISILKNDFFSCKEILLSNVSKAIIEADNNLVFYNNNNDKDFSFDMDNLRKDERQLFINILSKKVLLTIDPQIAKENNYTLPNDAIKEESTPNRRRKVTTTAEIIPIKATNNIAQSQRNIELDTQEVLDSSKKTKRILEL